MNINLSKTDYRGTDSSQLLSKILTPLCCGNMSGMVKGADTAIFSLNQGTKAKCQRAETPQARRCVITAPFPPTLFIMVKGPPTSETDPATTSKHSDLYTCGTGHNDWHWFSQREHSLFKTKFEKCDANC